MGEIGFDASDVIAVFAALIAVVAVLIPWWYQRNQLLLEQAVKSLERAYEALTDKGQSISPPAADRLNWLTAARHIARYRMIKAKIAGSRTHRLLCEEHEEYWRHQFYLCLKDASLLPLGYYQSGPIEPQSAIIIHGFSEWPENKRDPINDTDTAQILEKTPIILKRHYGLGFYLESLPAWKDRAKK